jgi:cytochrome c biogenesis protein
MNQPFDLDANTTVTLAEYIPDFFIRDNQVFKRSDDPVNPAFRLMVTNKASAQEAKLWIFPAYNPNAQGEKANYGFAYRDMQMGYFTGLSVSHQPGQWGVWVGVLLMSLGLGVAFYMVHMRLWVAAIPNAQGKLVLWIGGMANKNRDRFEQKFGELVDEIRTELEQVQPKVKTKLKSTESELNLTIAH